jgi:hypothetical protein
VSQLVNTKKERLIMKKTISLNSFIVAKIEGTIANYPKLEKNKFYVLIDLIIRHSKYNEGMHAYLMTEILRGQQFLGKRYEAFKFENKGTSSLNSIMTYGGRTVHILWYLTC